MYAAELEVTPLWRYGYYRAHHGAVLVKTRNIGQLAPNNSDASGDGVRAAMAQELRLVPTKTYLEVGLYIILLAQAFFGAPWLIAKFLANKDSRFWAYWCQALSWAIACTIAFLPLLIDGYGKPLYSTWVGQGARSYSVPYSVISPGNGLTVSDRTFIETAALSPVFLAVAISGIIHFPRMNGEIYLWLVSIIFYGSTGFLSEVIMDSWYSRREPPELKAGDV